MPAELRNEVYELVREYRATEPIYCARSPRRFYEMTEVSRQVRTECLSMAYEQRTFHFNFWRHREKEHVKALHHDTVACIVRFQIKDYQFNGRSHWGHCTTIICINLAREERPVVCNQDDDCFNCKKSPPEIEDGVQRVKDVVLSLEKVDGIRAMTKTKLLAIFEAAAWPSGNKFADLFESQ